MIPDEEIKTAMDEAYIKAGNNAYFGNGFSAGVKFALEFLEKGREMAERCITPNCFSSSKDRSCYNNCDDYKTADKAVD